MKTLAVLILLVFTAPAFADKTIYDRDGRRIQTETRDGSYYDRDGRRDMTSDRDNSKRYYGRDGELEYDESED